MPTEHQPYHLHYAETRRMSLRERLAAQVAELLHERGWTQLQSAQYLGVSQPRISDLVRGQTHKFTLDTLVEWLLALGRTVTVNVAPRALSESEDPEAWLQTVAYQTRLLELEPDNTTALGRRGSAYAQLRDFPRAIADYSRQWELDRSRCGALFNRARVYGEAGKFEQALADYAELDRLFPDAGASSNRGLLYEDMGRNEEALADYTRAIEHAPHRPGPWWNRARLLESLGRIPEAISDYRRAFEADPDYAGPRDALTRLGASV